MVTSRHDSGARSDAVLIRRSFEEPAAFGVLVERHSPAIYRYVLGRIGSPDADDVVAEVFMAAFARRQRYDMTRDNAAPWLFGIAANLIGRHRRQVRRSLRTLAQVGVDPTGQTATDRVDDIVTAQEAAQRAARELARMPSRYREVLLLVAWADLSYEQVAEALDIPVGTVRSRLSRAREKMKAALGGDPRTVTEESNHG